MVLTYLHFRILEISHWNEDDLGWVTENSDFERRSSEANLLRLLFDVLRDFHCFKSHRPFAVLRVVCDFSSSSNVSAMASILLTLLVPWVPCLGSRIMSTSDSDPFSGFQLFGPWTASSAGCTSTGWKGKYSIYGGAVEILSLEVGPESTTFTFNSELVSQVAWKLIFWGVALLDKSCQTRKN